MLLVVFSLSEAILYGDEEFMKVVDIGDEVYSISLTFGNLNECYVMSLQIPFQCCVRVPILILALFVVTLLIFSALVLVDGFLSLQRLC